MDTNKMREKFAEVRSSLAGQWIQGNDWVSAYRSADEALSFESFRLGWEASRKSMSVKLPKFVDYPDSIERDMRESLRAAIEAQGLKVTP